MKTINTDSAHELADMATQSADGKDSESLLLHFANFVAILQDFQDDNCIMLKQMLMEPNPNSEKDLLADAANERFQDLIDRWSCIMHKTRQ